MAGSPTRQLPPYAELLELREGTKDRDPMTLAAIGERFGTSRQAVGRALDRGRMQAALKKSKEVSGSGR